MLELVGLSRRFGEIVALDDLSLNVAPGSLFGLLGPNGAGKSTVIRIVVGLLTPDAGYVRWQGNPVRPAQRLRFGYLPEERGLYTKMRVLDQLVYYGRLYGMDRAAANASASAWLDRLGIAGRAGDKVESLSLGNQQRVQLIAALVHDPELLIHDEPFSGLDPVAVDVLAAVLVERVAAGVTVVFSSHQLDLVEDLCESVAIVDRGRMVLAGRVDQLKRSSGRRQLRVHVETDANWASDLPGVELAGNGTSVGTHLLLDPQTDPLTVLDRAAQAGHVVDFTLELPRLSQLFREAVHR